MTSNTTLNYDPTKIILSIDGINIVNYIETMKISRPRNREHEDMKNFKSCLTGLSPKGIIENDRTLMKMLYNWNDEYIDKLYKRYVSELKSKTKIYDYSKEDKRKWHN